MGGTFLEDVDEHSDTAFVDLNKVLDQGHSRCGDSTITLRGY